MVVPLFNPVLLMCKFEKSKTEAEKVNTLMLRTFKRYHLMIPKNASSKLVYDMIGDYYDEIAARKKHNTAEKWFARREDREPELLDKLNQILGAKSSNNNVGSVISVKIATGITAHVGEA